MHWLVPTVPVAAQGITTGIFSRHSALRDVVSGEIRHGRSWNWLRWRYVELKFHPNLKVGFVLTCFYYRGLVKVLFCVLRANSFPYTGYLGPNICQVSLGASKKGVGPMGATPCLCLVTVSVCVFVWVCVCANPPPIFSSPPPFSSLFILSGTTPKIQIFGLPRPSDPHPLCPFFVKSPPTPPP